MFRPSSIHLLLLFTAVVLDIVSANLQETNDDDHSGYSWFPLVSTVVVLTASTIVLKFIFGLKSKESVPEVPAPLDEANLCCKSQDGTQKRIKIFYATQTGNAKKFSDQLQTYLETKHLTAEVVDLSNYDPEDKLVDEAKKKTTCVFIVATYVDGKPPDTTSWFFKWLDEASHDFRVQKSLLRNMKYAVFGLGNSLYAENFNSVSRNLDSWLHLLQAHRIASVTLGDENVTESKFGGIENDFTEWTHQIGELLKERTNTKCACAASVSPEQTSADEQILYESSSEDESPSGDGKSKADSDLVDLEDIGSVMKKMKKNKLKADESGEPREMITPALREVLTKQGYRLIGSHSGVKLCRWTKSMLRGRGGCYKHTFYGIASHQCMETTPSLACANKCVFCWRHHSNPVGTEWKWKMDNPDKIVNDAMQYHYKMIKEFKGVPGVKADRFAEGMRIRHCALSLVGEPIMYPEINKLIDLLHEREISTFLVTNAQFPEEIRKLSPVTQLYVSVDASTKDSLKKIDRPLFKDFWPRFLNSLTALSEKGQRTVYRLTLVKAWNVEELSSYADLVKLGKPDFIEIKGVTYCGTSKGSNLTMENVPWHEEVVGFVQKLSELLPDYEIASEHVHSNCVLVANKKFKVNGDWWTWIDYDKFHHLVQRFTASGGVETFSSKDYMGRTPNWAVFGASEQGFDPVDTRFYRKNRKDISGC